MFPPLQRAFNERSSLKQDTVPEVISTARDYAKALCSEYLIVAAALQAGAPAEIGGPPL
jgi:hypothetical protein